MIIHWHAMHRTPFTQNFGDFQALHSGWYERKKQRFTAILFLQTSLELCFLSFVLKLGGIRFISLHLTAFNYNVCHISMQANFSLTDSQCISKKARFDQTQTPLYRASATGNLNTAMALRKRLWLNP